MAVKFHCSPGALLLPVLFLAAGCTTSRYQSKMTDLHSAYTAGKFDNALAVTEKKISRHDGRSLRNNALLWQVNHAAILNAAGRSAAAEEHWEIAQPLFEKAWNNERLNLARTALGMVVPGTKDSTYYAKPYEGVMIHTYRMLNALQLEDINEARRHLIGAMEFRDEVIKESEKLVEKRKAAVQKARAKNPNASETEALAYGSVDEGLKSNKKTEDGTYDKDSNAATRELLTKMEQQRKADNLELKLNLEGYANYANPLTGFLTYLFLRTHGTGLIQTDNNNVRRELDDLSIFTAKNSVVRELVQDAGAPLDNSVFVFFETGLIARQKEERFDLPIPSEYITHIGFAYPKLVLVPNYVQQLAVTDSAGNKTVTESLVNFDALAKQTYDDRFAAVIAGQIAQTVVNATINVALNVAATQATKQISDSTTRGLVKLGTMVGTAVLSAAMTEADTRSWELLPKEIQVARIDIPPDRKLSLLPAGGQTQKITLNEGNVMIVWVKSTGPQQLTPAVTQFKLK